MRNYNRVNIYMPISEQDLFDKVADKLQAEGVKGMHKGNGSPNQSAIVLYLLRREIGTSERK